MEKFPNFNQNKNFENNEINERNDNLEEETKIFINKNINNIKFFKEVKMNVMEEIINVDVEKNIYHIQLFILILKQSMMVKLQKVQMQIKFRMVKEEEDLEKIF